jgi:hypothetical protein
LERRINKVYENSIYKRNMGDFKGMKVQETWSGSTVYEKESNLIENKEFEVELEYVGFSRGRSSLNSLGG